MDIVDIVIFEADTRDDLSCGIGLKEFFLVADFAVLACFSGPAVFDGKAVRGESEVEAFLR